MSDPIQIGKLLFNPESRDAWVGQQPIPLTNKESRILQRLALSKGRVVSRDLVMDHLYSGKEKEPYPKIIDVFVCHLRKKIARATGGQHYIETVFGVGYALRAPGAPQ
jgi:two-component system cell cycle response regulator CtrA